jgi:hypothetical protein
MARNVLQLSHYEARRVLLPAREGEARLVEALHIVVFGPYFPQRAIEPELLVGVEVAQRTSIARDQHSIQGFFLREPHDKDAIRVRYGDSLEGELRDRFARTKILPLQKECGDR